MLSVATSIVKRLVGAGHIAYFAGGWVRDHLMQRTSDDIDIATTASVAAVQSLFPKTIPVGVAFGIVIVVEGGHQFEVATFRKDRGYVDGRRPTSIEPATPEEDAQRRDFTINGMFLDPLSGSILDYVGGRQDIEAKLIRAIGAPRDRFLEDRLRMMRAVRYATRFDFTIEPETLKAIYAHADTLLPAVAMERIWQEFKKMSRFAHFDAGLLTLHRLHLLPRIFPALKEVSVEEVQKRLSHVAHFPSDAPPLAELLELFPGASLEEWLELCDYLKLSGEEKQFVRFYHRATSLLAMPKEWQEGLELIEWAHFYSHPHAEICLQIAAAHVPQKEPFMHTHQQRRASLAHAIRRLQAKDPLVRSEDLVKEGVRPGRQMGLLLREAERLAVNAFLETKEEVLRRLRESSLWNLV